MRRTPFRQLYRKHHVFGVYEHFPAPRYVAPLKHRLWLRRHARLFGGVIPRVPLFVGKGSKDGD